MPHSLATIILAAGRGTRMKSSVPKVLHPLLDKPMLASSLKLSIKSQKVIVVTSPETQNIIQKNFENYDFEIAIQDPPLGTGHAVMAAMPLLHNFKGTVLITNGDMPLITPESIQNLLSTHQKSKALLTLTATNVENSHFGRVVLDASKKPKNIVEYKDATSVQKKIKLVNVGLYAVDASFLKTAIKELKNKNAQKEYYLTDLVNMAYKQKKKTALYTMKDVNEAQGVNSQEELMTANKIKMTKNIKKHLENGVTILNDAGVMIGDDVTIGSGTIIYGPCTLLGKTSIGKECTLEPGLFLENVTVGNKVHFKAYVYARDAILGNEIEIGPFAQLRPETKLANGVKVGNFSEIKKSTIGEGSKVNHLSYIGDATIGKKVNIGAGTITCNYDGVKKYQTILEDGVFVGSDTQFVAPVTVGEGAYIGAGSTITKNVKKKSLALTRSQQTEIENWADKKKK
ncbi:bifunctional UDP-N-acetylglucosamine diphosphorylase/glucosamine-1-phosphate N-acetyltransferase GlmU [bacterium]|nr:bifunctional UDP-N-acetylglucosamine diphosphorylase/glucosamine-1-phosphate N-acetyltransferase GlmU [bacterium]